METINITPKWSGIVPVMLEVLKNSNADPDSKRLIEEEIMRMAKIADGVTNLNTHEKN